MSFQISLLIVNENELVAGKPETIDHIYEARGHEAMMPPVLAYLSDEHIWNDNCMIETVRLVCTNMSPPTEDFMQKQWQYWNGDFPSALNLRQKGYGLWILMNKKGYANYALTRLGLNNQYQSNQENYCQPPLYVKISEKDYLNIYLRLVWKIINE